MNDKNNSKVPAEIMAGTVSERFDFFERKRLGHYRLLAAREQILRAVRFPAAGQLVLVFGPTGAGKSTLCGKIRDQLITDALAEASEDPGCIPVVSLELASPETGIFNWKSHLISVLLALDEPLVGKQVDYDTDGIRRNAEGKLTVNRRAADISSLRRAAEQSLVDRHVRAILLDEAHHLAKVGSGAARLWNQMDTIKSMANRTNTVHVLFGTYELLTLISLSDQLCRRAVYVHLPRYQIGDAADKLQFQGVLKQFEQMLPLPEPPNLVDEYELLFRGSLGCVGILKEWLDRSLVSALHAETSEDPAERSKTFTDYLRETALPERDLVTILREIVAGEESTRELYEGRPEDDLDAMLRKKPTKWAATTSYKAQAAPAKKDTGQNASKRRSRKPGNRNPVRDPLKPRKAQGKEQENDVDAA